jgi:hypothetical protein
MGGQVKNGGITKNKPTHVTSVTFIMRYYIRTTKDGVTPV